MFKLVALTDYIKTFIWPSAQQRLPIPDIHETEVQHTNAITVIFTNVYGLRK